MPARATRQEKGKRHSVGKEKVKLSLFTDDVNLHVEHPEENLREEKALNHKYP